MAVNRWQKGVSFTCVVVGAVCFGASAFAQSQSDDRRLQQNSEPLKFDVPTPNTLPDVSMIMSDGALVVNEADLLAHPSLLSRALLSALVQDSAQHVSVLLPIYQKQPQAYIETPMLTWANAVMLNGQKKYDSAIKHYQSLLQDYPDHALLSVRLGQALFANRQYAEALAIFSAQEASIQKELSPYFEVIARLQKPRVNVLANMINDKNINNAPKQRDLGGGWTAGEPQASQGVFVSVGVDKNYLLPDGVVFRPQFNVQTKRHKQAKHYDELVMWAGSGIGVHDHKHSLNITPFYERTYYAGGRQGEHKLHYFSHQLGVQMDYDWRAYPNLSLSVSAQATKNRYQTRQHLDGHGVSISPSVSFTPKSSPDVMMRLALDYQHIKTQDKDDSYIRQGVRANVSKQWGDVGVLGSVGVAQRKYQAPAPIFNRQQINHEYQAGVSIWHDKIRYKHFVPRLSYHYQKTDSNIGLYSYDKGRLFVEMTGRF